MEDLQCSGPLPGRTRALRLTPKARASRRLGFSQVSSVCQPQKMLETGPRTQEEDTGGHPRFAEPEGQAVSLPTSLTRPQKRWNTASLSAVPFGSPDGTVAKNTPDGAGDAGDLGLIPESGRSPRGTGNPLQYSRLGNPMDKSLAGYRPWGHKELDTTGRLSTHAEVKRGRGGGGPKPLASSWVSDPQGGTPIEMEPLGRTTSHHGPIFPHNDVQS